MRRSTRVFHRAPEMLAAAAANSFPGATLKAINAAAAVPTTGAPAADEVSLLLATCNSVRMRDGSDG